MRPVIHVVIALPLLAAMLSGCFSGTLVDRARELGRAANEEAAPALVELGEIQCQRVAAQRRDLRDRINARAAATGAAYRAVAQSCDGDLAPDF